MFFFSNLVWQGQLDVLKSIIAFAKEKEQGAIEAARADGVEIVLEN